MQRDRSSRCTRGRDGGSRRFTCRQKEDSCLKERKHVLVWHEVSS